MHTHIKWKNATQPYGPPAATFIAGIQFINDSLMDNYKDRRLATESLNLVSSQIG
jgi:hypothetical protein